MHRSWRVWGVGAFCLILWGAGAVPAQARAPRGCTPAALRPEQGMVRVGRLRLTLGAPADASATPEVRWQGPLRAGACAWPLRQIEAPLLVAGGRYLYVAAQHEGGRRLLQLDLLDCATRWQSEAFAGPWRATAQQLNLAERQLALSPQCLPQ